MPPQKLTTSQMVGAYPTCKVCGDGFTPVWKLDEAYRKERIAALNDQARRGILKHTSIVITIGILTRGEVFLEKAMEAVITFDSFTEANNPHGERDFGSFELSGRKVFWKIDSYDRDRRFGSPDPANPHCTHRVVTVMLAEEY